jgi:hypothetical protein
MAGINGKTAKWARALLVAVLTLASWGIAFGQFPETGIGPVERTVLVSIPDRKLAVLENGIVLTTFPVAVGASVSPSPVGEFQIVSRLSNPTYYHPGKVIPSGKENPLGTRWLGLSWKGYGIHGTNVPKSIGSAASHGCIRLRNRDAERLFELVQVGDRVQIRAERDAQTARVFESAPDEPSLASGQVSDSAAGQ